MAERYDVVCKVISQEGTCGAGHKVGDEWVISGATPAGICLSLFDAMYPSLRVLKFGGAHPWDSDPDVTTLACPDAENPLVVELRRVRP